MVGPSRPGDENPEIPAFRELVRTRLLDPGRLRAVAGTKLLDTEAEEAFDRIAALAAGVLGTPWAFVTVVDDRRSYWKACFGVEVDNGGVQPQNDVGESFCQYVIGADGPFLIADARQDPRTAGNPSIVSMGVVAWAGHPIRLDDGHVVGTVCVVDDRVREWTARDAQVLAALAAIAEDEIKLRNSVDDLDRAASQLSELASEAARTEALLDTVLSRAPVGFALVDNELRYLLINDALAAINGLPVEAHLGRRPTELLPGIGAEAESYMSQVLATGIPAIDVEHVGRTPAQPDIERAWAVSYYRIETGGEVLGVALLVTEVTARRRSEQRLRRLIDGLFTFVALLTPEGRVNEVNRPALDAGGLTMDDVRTLSFWDTYWWSHDPQVQQRLQESVREVAAGSTVRYDVEVRVAGDQLITIDFQLVPLVEAGEITGLVASGLDISDRLAARRRTEGIAHLARRLTCTASTADAAAVIATHGPAVLGASAARVSLVDRQRGVLRVVEAPDGAGLGLDGPRELGLDQPGPLSDTVRTGSVVVIADDGALRRRYPTGATGHDASTVTAPLLRPDGSVLGTLQFRWGGAVPDDATSLLAVETVADLCAQTLDRTLQADASHDLVGSLQEELLTHTAEVPGLDIAVRYQPAARDLGFGGDWYDVVPLCTRRTAVVIGDVAGHGVAAAAQMAQARTVISTLVQVGDDLGGLFDRAGELLRRHTRSLYATVSIAIIDLEHCTLTALSAGHPPPLVLYPDARAVVLDPARRPLLGIPGPRLEPSTVEFPPGAALVTFSDGLVERRTESLDQGLQRLRRQLERLEALDSSAMADAILTGQLQPHHPDDVALAVVRRLA